MTYGVNAANGLQPLYEGAAANGNYQVTQYPITSTYSTAMYQYDPVTLSTAGTVIVATASTAVLGVLMGVGYKISSNPYTQVFNYWPGNPGVVTGSAAVAFVLDDPRQRYTIQETATSAVTSPSGTPLTNAAIGNNANFLYTAGTSVNGISAVSLDNTTSATTLVGNLKIVGSDPSISNVAVGTAFQNWVVELNNSVFKAGSTRP